MSTQILMPALSPTMEEGKLAKWHVKEGDAVKAGDILAEIETDKATMEFEAIDAGKIAKLLVPEGADGVKVNVPIAELTQEGEEAPAPSPRAAVVHPAILPLPNGVGRSSEAASGSSPVSVIPSPRSIPSPVGEGDLPGRKGGEAVAPEIPEGVELVTTTVRDA